MAAPLIGALLKGGAKVLGGKLVAKVMSWFKKDEKPTEEELTKYINEQIATFNSEVIEHVETMERQITNRHKTDMQSDSVMSKNIRPGIMIYSLITYTILGVADSNVQGFSVEPEFLATIGNWVLLGMLFYFGGRSAEKIVKTMKNPGGTNV